MPTPPRMQPVYTSLNRPLTIGGAERRLFLVALVMGGTTFTFFGSLLGGLLGIVFGVVLSMGYLAFGIIKKMFLSGGMGGGGGEGDG